MYQHIKYVIYDLGYKKIAVIRGTRVYLTKKGKEMSYEIIKHQHCWELKNEDGLTIFQMKHQSGEFFKEYAELFFKRNTNSNIMKYK